MELQMLFTPKLEKFNTEPMFFLKKSFSGSEFRSKTSTTLKIKI